MAKRAKVDDEDKAKGGDETEVKKKEIDAKMLEKEYEVDVEMPDVKETPGGGSSGSGVSEKTRKMEIDDARKRELGEEASDGPEAKRRLTAKEASGRRGVGVVGDEEVPEDRLHDGEWGEHGDSVDDYRVGELDPVEVKKAREEEIRELDGARVRGSGLRGGLKGDGQGADMG